MVLHDLPRSMVINQIVFDQEDLYSNSEFERTMDRRCQALVSKFKTSDTKNFYLTVLVFVDSYKHTTI